MKWKSILIKILRIIVLSMLLIVLALYFGGNYLIFFPQKYPIGDWYTDGFNLEDHTFVTVDNVKLHGWFFPGEEGKQTILYCHGNAGNITTRLDRAKFLQQKGFSVFLFDYRGFGKSEGTPSEKGLYKDAEAAYDYLVSNKGVKNIIFFGESLGAAVTIYLVDKREAKGMILEAPFLSIAEMSKKVFGFKLPKFILSSTFPSNKRIPKTDIPLLVIHGTNDKVIPFSHGKEIYNLSPAKIKEFFPIENAGHNDTYYVAGYNKYYGKIDEFIQLIE